MLPIQSTTRTPYICARCFQSSRRRLYSSQSDSTPPPPPPLSGAAKLPTRRLISLHGSDASKFLHGIITASLRPESRSPFYTAFLTAQGKVLSDSFIYPTLGSKWHKDVNEDEDVGYLVEVDGEQANGLMKQLKRHKLRSKFKLRLLEQGELNVWSKWMEEERWTAHTQGKAENEEGMLIATDSRAPGMGQRLLLGPQPSEVGDAFDGLEEAPPSAYHVRRYMRGVAEGQTDIPSDESLPMNCNIDVMGGIDFKKGCYIGQELTIRTHHTGVVRRRVLPIALYDLDKGPPVELVYDPTTAISIPAHDVDVRRDDQRRRATGKFIAGIGNVGLATCRLEQMSDLTVSGEGSSFDPGDRFMVQSADGTEIGVKAFVPDWLRGQIREPKIQRRVG